MESVNILYFFPPVFILYLMFVFMSFFGQKHQPFGLKTKEVDLDPVKKIRKPYLIRITIVSIPIIIGLSIASMWLINPITGSLVMISVLLLMLVINMTFYVQAYKKIKKHLQSLDKSV